MAASYVAAAVLLIAVRERAVGSAEREAQQTDRSL
jgi:hypothetical protein